MNKKLGLKFEQKALNFLLRNKKEKLELITQNFYSRFGEIDLILKNNKQNLLIFCEVKSRKQFSQVSPLESINLKKQKRIITTAQQFLQQNSKFDEMDCRFDVVSLIYINDKKIIKIEWIKEAFTI